MPASTVEVNLGPRRYDIVVTSGDLAGAGRFAREHVQGTQAFLITDEHVDGHAQAITGSLEAAGFQVAGKTLPSGESQKSLEVAALLYDRLLDAQADRRTLVVAVGGGVIGDLAGFVAATFARGLPLLMVPTTLLAMVDSAVGGKVAVNLPRAKNIVGTFHQPVGVWIDTSTLASLPEREYRSGLAEIVKYGIILDPELFVYLEENQENILARQHDVVCHLVKRCCRLKADVVEQDEREEKGLRVVLNYGHTFAHAFEIAAGFGTLLHGEAVAMGMTCASRLAQNRGLIPADVTDRQTCLLEAFKLPTQPEPWLKDQLIETMRLDKKAQEGRLRFILPRRLGEVALFDDVAESDVRAVLAG